MIKSEDWKAAYLFHEKWAPFPGSMEAWKAAELEGRIIAAEQGNTPLIIGLIDAAWQDLLSEYKKTRPQAAEAAGYNWRG